MADAARRAVAELAASQHRAFTRRQAAELNFDSRRIATAKHEGWISEPLPGVLILVDGVELATLELSAPASMRFRPQIECVIDHVTMLEPCDVRALTSARRHGLDLARTRRVVERLHRPGQRGTGVMLRLLDSIPWDGQLPATWFEELLALCLDDPDLPEMRLQHSIRNAAGDIVARPGIAFPCVRLGVEAHSRRFHTGPDAEPLDEQRDIAAARCGWELTYLGWFATKRPAELLRIVEELIAVRSRDVGREL